MPRLRSRFQRSIALLARTTISAITTATPTAAITTTTAASTATTVTTAPAASAGALFAWPGFRDSDVTSIHILAVQRADGGLRFFRLGHGDESKTARAARDAICDEIDVLHDPVSREEILQTQFRGVEGKVPDKQFVVHDDSNLLGLTFSFPGLFPNRRVSNHH